jgi:hypothetical protein
MFRAQADPLLSLRKKCFLGRSLSATAKQAAEKVALRAAAALSCLKPPLTK